MKKRPYKTPLFEVHHIGATVLSDTSSTPVPVNPGTEVPPGNVEVRRFKGAYDDDWGDEEE